MAVYTEVTDEALAAFLADYDIGSMVAFRGIAEGVENSNFSLRTTAGDFILTLVRKARGSGGAALVPRADGASGAARHRLPAAGARARRRRRCGICAGGMPRSPRSCPASGRAGCGRSIARRWARRWPRCTSPGADYAPTRRNALGPHGWTPLLERSPRAGGRGAGRAWRRNWSARSAGSWRHGRAALPVGHIHADLFPDNVFFLDGRLSGLIDFYFAATDILAYDVAVCLNAWCFEPDFSFNVTKARSMLRAYDAIRAAVGRRTRRRCRCCARAPRSGSC